MCVLLFLLQVAVTMPKMAGDAIVNAVRHLNVYGATRSDCCLVLHNSKVRNRVQKPCLF